MSSSRLVELLSQAFQDTETAQYHQKRSRHLISSKGYSRGLDGLDELSFPILPYVATTNGLVEHFRHIANKIESDSSGDYEDPRYLSFSLKIEINYLVYQIIQIACSELLDTDNNIRQEIIKLMNWSDLPVNEEENITSLLSSYVSHVIANITTIMQRDSDYRSSAPIANPYGYINQIKETQVKLAYSELRLKKSVNDVVDTVKDSNAAKPLGMFGLFAGAMGIAYVLYQALGDDQVSLEGSTYNL